ncbi:hypothetical protein [Paenibacillus methanolicus]|uniref:DUF4367 domain-containing protein n=1 Tax=Paenibacillus methanolicus TaxID=582686 RepID=A0A5S5BQS7_9BACL|nr:hypothetical protein [Paenibacillus methanolicus]TYP69565.1 hypothetical protein BCM02_11481 [Paenibacillus methanolicus]
MRTEPFDKTNENERTEEAWRKLQEKLAGEKAGGQWAAWAEAAKRAEQHKQEHEDGGTKAGSVFAAPEWPSMEKADGMAVAKSAAASEQPVRKRMRMSRRRKWGAAAAACLLLGTIIATPAGNQALAAILNQFRAQQITVVNEEDLRNLFESVAGSEAGIRETVNKFGTYTTKSGQVEGEYPVEEAERLLGFKPVVAEAAGLKVSISPSTTITFNLNVDEVNAVMKRLGATTLMPEAIDGKPVALELGERAYYDGKALGAKGEEWAYLYEQKAPVVTVDPSVPVDKALDAVLDFPLLPEYLKRDLQQSQILEGKLPIPMLEGQQTEKLDVEGTQVVLNTDGDRDGDGTSFSAVWIHDGRLFELEGGNLFKTREAMLQKIGELIG